MKTTSYIIVGLLGLGAVGAFGVGAYLGHAMSETPKIDTINVGGELSDASVGRFEVLDTEVKKYCDTLRMDFISELVIKVSEDESLDTPRLTMNADWGKYLTVRESGDSLILDFDFHECMPGKTFTRDRVADNPSSRLKPFAPADIMIAVPKGMLKCVNPDRYTRFTFNGLEADSLDFGLLTSMSFDMCRIGELSFSGNVDSGFIDGHWDGSVDNARLSFNGSQIGLLTLDVPVGTFGIAGEGSMIEKLVWNDASTEGGHTAFLNAPKGTFRQFEWNSPTYENTLQYQLDLNAKGKFSITD